MGQDETIDSLRAERDVLLKVIKRVRRWAICDLDKEWPSSAGLDAEEYGDALTDQLKYMLCSELGHKSIRDHCGKPEHDYCLWCHELTPGKARR